jgi:hypothetical protein
MGNRKALNQLGGDLGSLTFWQLQGFLQQVLSTLRHQHSLPRSAANSAPDAEPLGRVRPVLMPRHASSAPPESLGEASSRCKP